MHRKLAITFILLAILGFSLAGQALAQSASGEPGVKPGDYLVYSIISTWSSTNPALAIPAELLQYNETLRYNVTVEAVQDANVTILNSLVFINGTTQNAPSLSNTDSGQLLDYLPDYPAFQGLFDSNLAANSLLYPSGNESVIINQTVTRNYASGNRATNIVSNSFPLSDINNQTGTETITFYIDKSTGVLVERNDLLQFPDYTASIIWTLKATNLWTVSAEPLPIPLPIIIAIVVIIVVLIAVVVFYSMCKQAKKKSRR